MKRIIRYFYMFGIFVICTVIIGLLLQHHISNQILLRNTERITELSVSLLNKQIDNWLNDNAQLIEISRDHISTEAADKDRILAYLTMMLKNNPGFASIYFGSVDNKMINASGWVPPLGFDLRTRPWYLKAISANRLVFSQAFVNASKDKVIITIAAPVYNPNGKLLGVVGGDVSLETIIGMVRDKKVGKSGFSFLIDGTGNLLAHPDYQYNPGVSFVKISDKYTGISEKLLQGPNAIIPISISGEEGYLAYQSVKGTDWHLASFVPLSEYTGQFNQLLLGLGISLVVSLLIILAFLWLQSILLIRPMARFAVGIGKIDIENNRDYRLKTTEGAAFAHLAHSVNSALEKASSYLTSLTSNEVELNTSNQQLATMIEKLNVQQKEMEEQNKILLENEKMLKESEENFRTFFETVDDMIFVGTPDGKIIFTNRAVTQKLGYSPEELLNVKVLDAHPEEHRREAEVIFAEMFRGERDYCPLPLRKKKGGYVPVETRVWLGRWGGQDCIYSVSKDLSIRQAALEKFQKLFNNNPALMAVSTMDGTFIDVNRAFLENLGYTKNELLDKTINDLGLFTEPEKQEQIAATLLRAGRIQNIELKVKKKDGTIMDGLFFGEVLDNQMGKTLFTVMTDITERNQFENELKRQTTLLSGLLDSIPDLVFFKDINGVYLGCNPQFSKFAGKSRRDIIGHTDFDLFSPDIAEFFRMNDKAMIEQGKARHNEEWIDYPDGQRVLIETVKAPLRDSSGEMIGLLGVSRDITERKRLEDELQKQAQTDVLTGIFNRRHFINSAELELRRNKRYQDEISFLLFDIDHFKKVNDTYGHAVGDIAIQTIVNTSRGLLRDTDIFGRIGGEEFAVLLLKSNLEAAKQIAERIRLKIQNTPLRLDEDTEIPLRISIGVTRQISSDDTLADIMARSDQALYQAKNEGRNRVVVIE